MATSADATNGSLAASETKQQELPKLMAQEFRVYNSMADHMNYFVRIECLH